MGHRYELPIVSFLCAILVLLPLPWHWKARNVATLSLIAWLFLSNIIRGINSIIWMDNVVIHYQVWCDIATKFLIGVSVALPACSFTLTRHLEHVASARYVHTTAAEKRRRCIIDLCFTLGIPIVIMALHYIVQGHRFDILEDFGCQPFIYTSVAGIVIMFVTPLLLSVGSMIYATLALRHFAVRRMQFEQHLKDSKSALTTARYMRLMALALTEMLWGTSLTSFVMYENISKLGLRPWISWDDVHYDFGRIALYPNFLVPNMGEVLLTWWIIPSTAILFFLFFGFSDEAREGYATIFRWISRVVFRRTPARAEKLSSLPQYRGDLPVRRKRVSMDECSIDIASLKDAAYYLPPSYSAGATETTLQEDDYRVHAVPHLTLPSFLPPLSPTFSTDESIAESSNSPHTPVHETHHEEPPQDGAVHISTSRETF